MNTSFLKGLGLEQDAIDKIMAENGKDVAKEQKKTETVQSTLDGKITELGELSDTVKSLKNLEGSDKTIKDLQTKIADLEGAEKTRISAEKAEKENAALFATFEEVSKEKPFVNDFTKNAIFESCKGELAKDENKGKGLKDIFADLTTDKEGIFANPNQVGGTSSTNPNMDASKLDTNQVRAVMGLPPEK